MSKEKPSESPGNAATKSSMAAVLETGRAHITATCSTLGLGENVLKLANVHWEEFASHTEQDVEDGVWGWLACMVYIASVDSRFPYGLTDPQAGHLTQPQITVSQLLRHANVNILDFFKKMRMVKEFCPLSEASHAHLLALEKKFCITSAIFYKFSRIFDDVMKKEDEQNIVSGLAEHIDTFSHKKEVCWALFIYAKSQLLGNSQELVTTFHLLLCCVEHILSTIPAFQLLPPFDLSKHNRENDCVGTLAEVCQRFSAAHEEVKSLQKVYFTPFLQKLPHNNGALDVEELRQSYLVQYRQVGDIDELSFLSADPHLVVQLPHKTSVKEELVYTKEHPPVTPVRSALNTVQQLRSLLNHSKDVPSAKLLRYYKNCARDPTSTIETLHTELKQLFMSSFVQESGDHQVSLAQQRFTSAMSLYYRVLEAMLIQEEERLSKLDFSNLLNNAVFHKCLLACSVEVVIMTYSLSWTTPLYSVSSIDNCYSFPWVLRVFNIHGYDFYKVLESFIKAEPKLTRDTIKHLQSIESKILESTAWESGSPLFDALAKFELTPPSLPIPTHSGASAADLYLSPIRPSQSIVSPNVMLTPTSGGQMAPPHSPHTPEHSPQSRQPPSPRRSQSLNLFFNKVCRLGFHRLQSLCNLLPVNKDLQHKIWTCFEHCVTQRSELLRDRHLDQIMMCSIYSICKVVEREIKFKVIVQMYRSLPHASQEVYRSVHIEQGITDSIIGFYNRVFTHRMKTYILQFSSNRQLMPSLSPVPKNVPSPLKASPVYSLPGRRNFYVSPMKESPFKMPPSPSQLTPRSRQLYSFGEGFGSSEKLKNINETMRLMKRRSPPSSGISRGQKRLKFDESSASVCESTSTAEVIVSKVKPPPHMRKCLAFSDPDEDNDKNQ